MCVKPYVIHTRKSTGLVKSWPKELSINDETCITGRHLHYHIIEDVLNGKYFGGLAGDVIVFMDHDYAWKNDVFPRTLYRLMEAMRHGAKVAWLKSPWMEGRSFSTCPMFAVRRCNETMQADAWEGTPPWQVNDTSVAAIDFRLHLSGFHIGGAWQQQKLRFPGRESLGSVNLFKAQKQIEKAMYDGNFYPSSQEIISMCNYGPFHSYLKRIFPKDVRFTEYDTSLYPLYRCDEYYKQMWNAIEPLAEAKDRLERSIKFMMDNKTRYEAIAMQSSGIPWYVIGVVHVMEAFDEKDPWACSLHNGLPWSEQNVHAYCNPKPGPFSSFEEAALHALNFQGLVKQCDIPNVSRYIENWNGVSKFKSLKLHSPYLYAHSNKVGAFGKYKRTIVDPASGERRIADQVTNQDQIGFAYMADAPNNQVGAIVILKEMNRRGLIEL